MRRFADGLSSWVVRRVEGIDEWMVFDRPSGSERDLVVIAEVSGATVVQRHPAGAVRIVGERGVSRWERVGWHHEPPVASWIDTVAACDGSGDVEVVARAARVRGPRSRFPWHRCAARVPARPGARSADGGAAAGASTARGHPPDRPRPLRHALAQVDGAAVFDRAGVLRELGARLIPSALAEVEVEGLRGMRHTAGRRYSYDDPGATVIVVSEDGPVTVLRAGQILGGSPTES